MCVHACVQVCMRGGKGAGPVDPPLTRERAAGRETSSVGIAIARPDTHGGKPHAVEIRHSCMAGNSSVK